MFLTLLQSQVTTPDTIPPNTADIGGDYTAIPRKFKLRGEKRKRLTRAVVKRVKEVVEAEPTKEQLEALTKEVLPFLTEPDTVVSELQAKLAESMDALLAGIEAAQSLASLEEAKRKERERAIIAILAIYLRRREDEEILVAYLI